MLHENTLANFIIENAYLNPFSSTQRKKESKKHLSIKNKNNVFIVVKCHDLQCPVDCISQVILQSMYHRPLILNQLLHYQHLGSQLRCLQPNQSERVAKYLHTTSKAQLYLLLLSIPDCPQKALASKI